MHIVRNPVALIVASYLLQPPVWRFAVAMNSNFHFFVRIVGNRVALIKTKHGTFSRTTDCVTPPFPLAPLPPQKSAVGDLSSDVTATHDQSQPAPITSTPNQSTGGGGPGRMITTSIDEGRSGCCIFSVSF